jgi:serine/threonine protein kinase
VTPDQRKVRLEAVFEAAIELTPDQRPVYLGEACRGDPDLRRDVEALIAAWAQANELFESTAVGPAQADGIATNDPVLEGPGTRIGPYRLLEEIGSGGFAVVFMAEQNEPMDTRQVIARFEAERQALALMEHPNIARVFDAGATPTGRPYFVMELVRGVPINSFCEERGLPFRERLRLLMEVCQAIQHAHQKGIIHRDIKPSNVLVTVDYGRATPKVIDFGVAKAVNQRLTEHTLYTRFSQLIGTPAYMSPEQADMSSLDIDTRTDVYALGVLLYELLTGTTPFSEKQLLRRGYDEMRRIIREEEPEPPSTRSTKLGRRGAVEQAALKPRGDLDWIVLKAIDKDRRRRYGGPREFADDVQRFLDDLPVSAAPPSPVYRLKRFVRRHRISVTAGSTVAVALFTGLALAVSGWIEAHQEQQATSQVTLFLQEVLSQADVQNPATWQAPNRDIKLLDVVNQASLRIHGRFEEHPLVEAAIRLTIGKVYTGLGETEPAEANLRRAYAAFKDHAGPGNPKTLEAAHALAALLRMNKGAYLEAEQLLNTVVIGRTALLGPRDRQTLVSKLELVRTVADRGHNREAEPALRELIATCEQALGPEDRLTLNARLLLTRLLWRSGHYASATQMRYEVLGAFRNAHGLGSPDALLALYHLAFSISEFENNPSKAEQLVEEGLAESVGLVGDWYSSWLLQVRKAVLLGQRGLYAESLALRQSSYESAAQKVGTNHWITLGAKAYIAFHLEGYGDYDDAISVLEEIRSAGEALATPTWDSIFANNRLAKLYWQTGHITEALELMRRSLHTANEFYGPEVPFTLNLATSLAKRSARIGQWSEAVDLFMRFGLDGIDSPRECMSGALACAVAARPLQAEKLARIAVERCGGDTALGTRRRAVLTGLLVSTAVHTQSFQDTLIPEDDRSVDSRLVAGIAAYRRGDWGLAIERLAPLPELSPDRSAAVLAGYYLAMSQYERRNIDAAGEFLKQADQLLERLCRTGDLGWRWEDLACCLIAREEVGRTLAHCEEAPPIDEQYLLEARRRWKPIKAVINDALHFARRREWEKASSAAAAVVDQAGFAWEAAELADPKLALKFALIFTLAGNEHGYRRVLDYHERGPKSLHGDGLFSISPNGLACRGSWEGRVFTRYDDPEWFALLKGLASIKAGELEETEAILEQALEAYNLRCACAANALGAILKGRQSEWDEAAGFLQRAETLLEQVEKDIAGDLGKCWFEVVLCELTVECARDVLAGQAKPQTVQP